MIFQYDLVNYFFIAFFVATVLGIIASIIYAGRSQQAVPIKDIAFFVILLLAAAIIWQFIPVSTKDTSDKSQPANLDQQRLINGEMAVPPQPRQAYVHDKLGRSYLFQETALGSGSFFVYPQQKLRRGHRPQHAKPLAFISHLIKNRLPNYSVDFLQKFGLDLFANSVTLSLKLPSERPL